MDLTRSAKVTARGNRCRIEDDGLVTKSVAALALKIFLQIPATSIMDSRNLETMKLPKMGFLSLQSWS